MPTLLIRHQGVDVERWHRVFLAHFPVRRAYGAISEVILRSASSPNEVWILIEWDDLYRAQLFAWSDDLQDQFDQAGITQLPGLWLLEALVASELSPHLSTNADDTPPLPGDEGNSR